MDHRRERVPVRGEARRADLARRPVAVDPVAAMLLGLQASAGNAAVQRLLNGSATVQRFWPFDDEEDSGGGEETVEAEDTGSIPNEEWGGGEASPGDTGGETPSEGAESAAEDWIGPGGDWGSEEDGGSPGGESQPDGTGEQDWIGPGGDGSGGDEGATGEGEFLTGSPEEQWNQAVEDDDFDEALAIVLRTYGFGGKYVYTIWFNPNEAHAAEAGGPYGAAQWISVGYDAFRWGFAWCASVIGHEMDHAKERAGDQEYHPPEAGEKGRPNEDSHLREFLAYSWEVLESPVRQNLMDEELLSLSRFAKGHYAYLDRGWKDVHEARYKQVLAVEASLPPPPPKEPE